MSGVRAHNEELTQLGLTLPGFVDRNQIIASLPSLGLLTLAGLTPTKFEVEYREIADLKERWRLPDDFDLVAISTFTAQIFEAYEVADFYRATRHSGRDGRNARFVRCRTKRRNIAPASSWAKANRSGRRCCATLRTARLKPFYIQSPRGRFDLRDAPMPRFDLLDPDKYNRITVQTSRGCPHQCDFCASSILLTPRYKLKPVEKVIAEIHAIKESGRGRSSSSPTTTASFIASITKRCCASWRRRSCAGSPKRT